MTGTTLAGKSVIITGGARGLGLAMAHGLAKAGANLLLADMDGEALEETVATAFAGEVRDRVRGATADVTSDAGCAQIAAACEQAFGRVDVLINNAGIGLFTIDPDHPLRPILLGEVHGDTLLSFLAVHAVGPIRMMQAVVGGMRDRGWGRIVTVTTSMATMTRGAFAPYGGAKAASEAYTTALSQELSDSGVTANILVPGGAADTRLVPDAPGLRREDLIRPEVMAAPAVWLASDASDGITGHRFIGRLWDPTLPPEQAMKKAGWPINWVDPN